MRECIGTTPLIDQRKEILNLLHYLVEVGHLIEHANESALSTRAIVSRDVDKESIIQLPDILQGINQSPDLVVGLFHEARKDLCLAGKESTVISG